MSDLNDSQLNFDYWFYRNLPQIKKITAASWLGLILIAVIFSITILTIELLKLPKHNAYLANTASAIKNYQDSFLNLRPNIPTIKQSYVLKTDNKYSDLVYLINNPNPNWLIWEAEYQAPTEGRINSAHTFILPGDKWLSFLKTTEGSSLAPNLEFKNIIWSKLSTPGDTEKIKTLNFKTQKVIFVPKDKLGQNRAYITILNNSPFSFKEVEINALAYKDNQLLALAKSIIENFKTFEKKEIFLGFGFAEIDSNPEMKIFVYVNVFDDSLILPFETPAVAE